jgi:hypothetical protein
MADKGVKARFAVAAAIAVVAGVMVAGVAGAGAQGVPPYTTSTSTSTGSTTLPTTNPNRPVRLRIGLRYKRNQPVSGAIVIRARCRVAGNVAGFVVSQSQGCFVRASGKIMILTKGNRSARRNRSVRLKPVKVNIRPRQTVTMRFKYKKRGMIKRSLKIAQRSADAHLSFNVSDEYGNAKTLRRKVHLRSGTEFR